MDKQITIAIDGYSSCGKSTMAKELARRIGYVYIDTGAMYRAVTLYALEKGLWLDETTPNEEAITQAMPQLQIELRKEGEKTCVLLNGQDVSQEIRSMEVSSHVSYISALPIVRTHLVAQQQEMGKRGGVVMDGRDIGTNVFPDAELKIFLTARPEVRAMRRLRELQSKGDTTTTLQEVADNLAQRDHLDSTRPIAPLKQAADAVVVDNSDLSPSEQDERLEALFNEAKARQ